MAYCEQAVINLDLVIYDARARYDTTRNSNRLTIPGNVPMCTTYVLNPYNFPTYANKCHMVTCYHASPHISAPTHLIPSSRQSRPPLGQPSPGVTTASNRVQPLQDLSPDTQLATKTGMNLARCFGQAIGGVSEGPTAPYTH
jgi:hypothetical protein